MRLATLPVMICFGLCVGALKALTPVTERMQKSYVPPKITNMVVSGQELNLGTPPGNVIGPRILVVLPECSSCNANIPLLPFKRDGELETLFLAPGDVSGWARLVSKGTAVVQKIDPMDVKSFNAEFQPRSFHINKSGKLDYIQESPMEFEQVIKELDAALKK
ncbi:MAG: hypothetical protein CBB60_005555 [Armatimonadetes bacterium Cent15-Ar3]|nr:MAG: hypothetical protein CBB60_005555 [Armatimonadetes bacterium Cent15-Ar3]